MRHLVNTALIVVIVAFCQLNQFARAGNNIGIELLPIPPGATLEIISDNFQHNGRSLVIAQLVSSHGIDASMEYYRTVWRSPEGSEIPGYVEQHYENWAAISRLSEGVNTVVQFDKTTRGSNGVFVSIMSLDQSSAINFNSTLHPGRSEILSSTHTNDLGRDSMVEVIKTSVSIASARRYYQSQYRRSGWNLVSDREALDSQVMLFNRKSEKTELVLSRGNDGSTLVIVNRVIYDG